MARGKAWKIEWEAGFVNTLEGGYPLDQARSWPEDREGTERVRSPAGEEDVWRTGTNEVLRGRVRYIPTTDGTTPTGVPITGWDGATGWAAFLKWARDGNEFRFYPDRDLGTFILSRLRSPLEGAPDLEQSDMTRALTLEIWNANDEAYEGY